MTQSSMDSQDHQQNKLLGSFDMILRGERYSGPSRDTLAEGHSQKYHFLSGVDLSRKIAGQTQPKMKMTTLANFYPVFSKSFKNGDKIPPQQKALRFCV